MTDWNGWSGASGDSAWQDTAGPAWPPGDPSRPSPSQAGFSDGWEDSPGAGEPRPVAATDVWAVATAPMGWLYAAGAAGLLSVVLAVLSAGRPLPAAAGWVLSAFVMIPALTMFVVADARRRTSNNYLARSWPSVALRVLSLVAAGGVVANALRFAYWAAGRWVL